MSERLTTLIDTVEEYDRLTRDALPQLLDRAAAHARRFMRETGQWADDIVHEKLALRWGYELLERFLPCGRAELPCRPLLLLDSLVLKYLSQPEPFCYHKDLCGPLGRFLDGLLARAVISRDALMALFHHVYGFTPGQVVKLLGFDVLESRRVYKNFERWRRAGWQRMIDEVDLSDPELEDLVRNQQDEPLSFASESTRLLMVVLGHYRKSDPQHFPCRSRQQWAHLYEQGYGVDYRTWHLAMCLGCAKTVFELQRPLFDDRLELTVRLHLRPSNRHQGLRVIYSDQGGTHGSGRPAQQLSTTSA